MIAEIQVLPAPAGRDGEPYAHVDAAIAVIESSGLGYEVGPLGTSVEGPPDEVWPLLRRVHDACLDAGADFAVTILKVAGGPDDRGPGIADLTSKFRR